jgi:hypothetical protein
MPSRVARLRLAQAVDSQFDTAVVAAFEAILTSASEDYRTGSSAEFVLTSRGGDELNPSIVEDLVAVASARAIAAV